MRLDAYTLAAWVTKIAVKRELGCHKPRYRSLRDIERPRYIGLRFAIAKAPQGFLPLMGRESSGTTEAHATGFSAGSAVAGPGEDQLAFEFSKASENCD